MDSITSLPYAVRRICVYSKYTEAKVILTIFSALLCHMYVSFRAFCCKCILLSTFCNTVLTTIKLVNVKHVKLDLCKYNIYIFFFLPPAPTPAAGHHGDKDEVEAEDRVRALLYGFPAGPHICVDAAR